MTETKIIEFPLSSLITEEEQIHLFAMLEALNDNPEDNSSERYFPIFDYMLKINGKGLGQAPFNVSVSERHWKAYAEKLNKE